MQLSSTYEIGLGVVYFIEDGIITIINLENERERGDDEIDIL